MAERKTWKGGTAPARSTRRYRRHVFVHHGHGLSFVAPVALFFLVSPWVAALVVVVLEILVIFVLPRLGLVQRAIDERALEHGRLRAALERAAMIAQMSEQHRRELTELDQIIANLKIRMDLPSDGGDISGLDELAALYVRLALAHRTSTEVLARAGSAAALDDVARTTIVSAETGDDDDATNASLDLRLDVLRARADARRSARRRQRAIEIDLATIGDAIRWMSEYCATAGAETAACELADRLACARSNAETVRELCSLRGEAVFGVVEVSRENGVLRACASAPTLRTRVGEPTDDATGDRSCEDLERERVAALYRM